MPRFLYQGSEPLTTCCHCFTLRSGCKSIGAMSMFICSMEIVHGCQKLLALLDGEQMCLKNNDIPIEGGPRDRYFSTCYNLKIMQFYLIIDFIISVLGFNGSILLLYGIKNKRPKLFWGWFIFATLVIAKGVSSIMLWHSAQMIPNFLMIIWMAYLFRVVRSYKYQLENDSARTTLPVVAVRTPRDNRLRIILPNQASSLPADHIKDDPPPPYPGINSLPSSGSWESQAPPPYSDISVNSTTGVSSENSGLRPSESAIEREDSNANLEPRIGFNIEVRRESSNTIISISQESYDHTISQESIENRCLNNENDDQLNTVNSEEVTTTNSTNSGKVTTPESETQNRRSSAVFQERGVNSLSNAVNSTTNERENTALNPNSVVSDS